MSLLDPERLYLRRHALLAYADQTRASAREMRDPRSRAQMLHLAMSNEDIAETLEGMRGHKKGLYWL